MDVREKLIEILRKPIFPHELVDQTEAVADYLLDSGVTVQEWIPVDDMLPDPFVSVLVQMPGEEPFPTVREGFISNDGIWQSAMFRRAPGEVTHWMQMPHPPKGE